jgi:hypothetical protein
MCHILPEVKIKKKLIIAGILICCIIIAVIYYSIPAPIFARPANVKIHRVEIITTEFMSEDITNRIDCNKLVQIISKYSRSRLPRSFAPYQMTVGQIDVDGIGSNGPFHIILGNDATYVNVIYSSAEKGGYIIQNNKELFNEILLLLND